MTNLARLPTIVGMRLFAAIALCLWVPVAAVGEATVDAGLADAQVVDPVLWALQQQIVGLDTLLPLDAAAPGAPCGSAVPVTRALLVGAQEWVADPLMHLAGPVNDTTLMQNTLRALGADPANLILATGAAATRAGLEEAAQNLLSATNCGDAVIIHLSGWVFGAAYFTPSQGDAPPIGGAFEGSLAAEGDLRIGASEPNRVIAMGPWMMLNAPRPGTLEVLSAAALSDLVTQLRNRGADVTIVVDTSTAESLRLEDRQAQVDPRGLWRARLSPGGEAPSPPLLSTRAGAFTVFYGTAEGEITLEMKLPKDAPDRRYYGAFSFAFASALLRAETPSAAAVARLITSVDPGAEAQRRWTYVFSTTEPDRPILAEARAAEPGQGTGSIRITDPAPSRSAAPLDSAALTLRGVVEAASDTMIVTVNGQVAASTPDGQFEAPLALQAGVNRIDIVALTRDSTPLTTSFELFFEGDVEALLGSGTRFALLISNAEYAENSGLADLQTPHGDAEALAEVLVRDYGFVTSIARPAGDVSLILRDATRVEIETALYEVSQAAGARDTVLIFYAGHGLYEATTDGAFWLPADARLGLPFSYLPSSAVTDALLRIQAGNIIVISDSCYSGAFLRGGPEAPEALEGDRLRALQRLAEKRSRIVIASGGNEPVADGGGDGHSVFARALLTGLADMEDRAFSARELFDRYLLPMTVGRAAQEPQYRPIERSGHEGGDVVLTRISP